MKAFSGFVTVCSHFIAFLITFVACDPVLPYYGLALRVSNYVPQELSVELQYHSTINTSSVLYELLNKWSPVCLADNKILARNEYVKLTQYDRLAPWTIAVETLQYLKSNNTYQCNSISSVIKSVSSGSRDCSLNLLSPINICEIFDKYSNIMWIGDSLSRHMSMGLHLLLTSDLQWGAVPTTDEKVRSNCQCDGQFSEHSICRFGNFSMRNTNGNKSVCSSLMTNAPPSFNFQYFSTRFKWDTFKYECPLQDKRPTFIFTQGGSGSTTDYTITHHWLNPLSAALKKFKSDCPQSTVHVVFSGANAQSRSLDEFYPGQSRENATIFNKHLQEVVHSAGYKWTWLDFFNMTMDVDTSDGYHYLSATNLQKANVVVQLMNLFADKEENYLES